MKALHSLSIALFCLFLQSCSTSEATEVLSQPITATVHTSILPDEASIIASNVDSVALWDIAIIKTNDSLGYVTGYTTECINAEVRYFKVIAPYNCIIYQDSVHSLDYKLFSKAMKSDTISDIKYEGSVLLGYTYVNN